MAQGGQVSVSTVPTAIVGASAGDTDGVYFQLHPQGGTVFLGGQTVTDTSGYALLSTDAPLKGRLTDGEAIYGVVTAGTVVLDLASTGLPVPVVPSLLLSPDLALSPDLPLGG